VVQNISDSQAILDDLPIGHIFVIERRAAALDRYSKYGAIVIGIVSMSTQPQSLADCVRIHGNHAHTQGYFINGGQYLLRWYAQFSQTNCSATSLLAISVLSPFGDDSRLSISTKKIFFCSGNILNNKGNNLASIQFITISASVKSFSIHAFANFAFAAMSKFCSVCTTTHTIYGFCVIFGDLYITRHFSAVFSFNSLSLLTVAMRASQFSQSIPQHAINCFILFFFFMSWSDG
jgi:hypothetical protein